MKQRVDYKLGYMLSRKQMDSLIQISRAGWSGKTSLEELTFKLRTEHRDERAWRRASREGQRSGWGACTCCRSWVLGVGAREGARRPRGGAGLVLPVGLYAQKCDTVCFLTLPRSLLCPRPSFPRRAEGETSAELRREPRGSCTERLLVLGGERPGVFWKLL